MIDCSKSVIALVSNDYLQSKVCNEEMCLSIALQLQRRCKILPILIEPLKNNVDWLDMLSPVICYTVGEEETNTSVAFDVVCNQFLSAFEGKMPGYHR